MNVYANKKKEKENVNNTERFTNVLGVCNVLRASIVYKILNAVKTVS